jgi:hypothetical protein
MKETKRDLFNIFDNLRRWNDEILKDIEDFQSLGSHTDDVDTLMHEEAKLAKRAKQEIFKWSKVLRFKMLRAHPKMLSSMKEIGDGYFDCEKRSGISWKYPDSQQIRGIDPELFEKREIIEAHIRDNLIEMWSDLGNLAEEYRNRYGEHEYIVSERTLKWIKLIGGMITTGAVAEFILRYMRIK